MAAPTRPKPFGLPTPESIDALDAAIRRAQQGSGRLPPLNLAGAAELKKVMMFQATIVLQSGKTVVMQIPADVTDADVLDLIMEIAKNISHSAREVTARSLLAVPGDTGALQG